MKQGNKLRLATIVCWCVVAVAMAGLAVWALTGTLFGLPTGFQLWGLNIGGIENLVGKYELVDTHSEPVSGVDSLEINWIAGSITVTPYDGAEIEFKEYAQRDLSDQERMSISVSNGKVSVRFAEGTRISSMPPKQLEVYVPRALSESMDTFYADATSGGISVAGITANKLIAGSTSGNIGLTDIHADDLSASSTSGDVTITRAVCGEIRLDSISGNLKTTDTRADKLSTDTTSGDQKLYGEFADADLDSISGDITLENGAEGAELSISSTSGTQTAAGAYNSVSCNCISGTVRITSTVVPDSLNIDTTSGDVTVTMPNNGGIAIRHSTVSGSLKSDIPMTLGTGSLVFSTISGDVRILTP